MARHDMKGLKNHKGKETEDVTEEGKASFGKRLESIRDNLKLGPHHKMERFTAILGGTLTFLVLFSVLSFVTHRSDVAQSVSAQAVYTEDFSFSLSGEKMYVEGVYGNEDQTDVMVLLRMQSPETMSTDAENYELFITGKKDSLSYKPDVTFSMFGSTGYGVIRFQHDESIPQEVADITIRANAELSAQEGSGSSGEKDSTDGSFGDHDQGKLYVNPGANDVETLDWLETSETDPSKLYTALVAESIDDEIHTEIEEHTDELAKLLNREKEYKNRLTSAGYEPPETPWFVEGDYVNEDGVFVAGKDLSGAFTFDYSTKTIRDGYINQVMDGLSDFDAYMKSHAEKASKEGDGDARKERVDRVDAIKTEDGATLDLTTVATGSSPSAQVAAKDSVESLQATWRNYLNTKGDLQRDLMRDLLILDADVLSQTSSYSTLSDKDTITFY